MARKKRQRWALLSVSDKKDIAMAAQRLLKQGIKLLASGGTARAIREAGFEVTDVAALTGKEAILGHRVVTLSGEVHAGLLARHWVDADLQDMEKFGLPYIDILVSSLYPMEAVIADRKATEADVIENTDIGGPCLLRSAAKGRRIIITDPSQYDEVLSWLEAGEQDHENVVRRMAADAEYIASCYSLASAGYISQGEVAGFIGRRKLVCKYGENPYQSPAALYALRGNDPLGVHRFRRVFGMDPSYNNLIDVERLLQSMTHVAATYDLNYGRIPFIAIAVKHGNACGAACALRPDEAISKMVEGDMRALLGGVVMTNFTLNARLAELLLTHGVAQGRRILDGVVVPGIAEDAVAMFSRKEDKCRVLVNEELGALDAHSLDTAPRFRYVRDGFVLEPNYTYLLNLEQMGLERDDPLREREELALAKAICDTSNSNTIAITQPFKGGAMLIGNGAGQQDRVTAAQFAVLRARNAKHPTRGGFAASDGFFPDPDGPLVLAKAGVSDVAAPTGSIKDEAVRAACEEAGIFLHLVPDSRGFYGH